MKEINVSEYIDKLEGRRDDIERSARAKQDADPDNDFAGWSDLKRSRERNSCISVLRQIERAGAKIYETHTANVVKVKSKKGEFTVSLKRKGGRVKVQRYGNIWTDVKLSDIL